MTKKRSNIDPDPGNKGPQELDAFRNMLNDIVNVAVARVTQDLADQAPATSSDQSEHGLTAEDLERMVEASSDHFIWLRYKDRFTAEHFIRDEHYIHFENLIDPERFSAFERKELPTQQELDRINEIWREQVIADDGNGLDFDEVPMCTALWHLLPSGQEQLVMICTTGYSFSGVRHWVQGVFETEEALWAYVDATWKGR